MATWSLELVKEAVAVSKSVGGALAWLHVARVGSNYAKLRARIAESNLDTTHWTRSTKVRKCTIAAALVKHSTYATGNVKRLILREQLIPYSCAYGCLPVWRGAPLVLRLDHKNGVRDDHSLSNLRFLCPNCDSQSSTFCGRNKKRAEKRSEKKHRKSKSEAQKQRFQRVPQKTKIVWPEGDQLRLQVAQTNLSHVSRVLGVSATAVKKRLRSRTLEVQG